MTSPATLNVGLLWHSARSGNLGVGALTVANMAIAREVAASLGLQLRFVIIGMRDYGASYLPAPEPDEFDVTGRSILSPNGCWAVIGRQDCLLDIGGGDSFAEIYGLKRFGFLWATQAMAAARGVPLLLSPQTIGPFTQTPYKQLAGAVLPRARAVVARDPISLQALRDLAPKAKGALSVDVAFGLPYHDRSPERGGVRLRVGVNVSGLLFNEAESGRNRFGLEFDYVRLMRGFIEHLLARPQTDVYLVAHVVDEAARWEDDGAVADRLAREYPQVVRVPNFAGPSEAKTFISSLDFLTGGRMHACIAAYSSGVPVVPVAYSRKFSGLFGMLGYSWMVPVRGKNSDIALEYLGECLERRDEMARDIEIGMSKVDGLLDVYRAELRELFSASMRLP
jgi:colanic acid/amylovoran biosynthesis protein